MKHTLVGHVPSNNIHHHIRMGACEGKEKVENGSQKYSACMNKWMNEWVRWGSVETNDEVYEECD